MCVCGCVWGGLVIIIFLSFYFIFWRVGGSGSDLNNLMDKQQFEDNVNKYLILMEESGKKGVYVCISKCVLRPVNMYVPYILDT